jgi:signal transduction histidine kinase
VVSVVDDPRSAAAGGVRVLIVEDDLDLRLLATTRLERHGFVVDGVDSGEAALEALAHAEFDLVLLDYRLPGRNGLETLRLLRARSAASVVLATGMGSEHVAVEALRAGAVDYLGKDQRFLEQLPAVMERAWRSHDLARRVEELQRQALLVTSSTDRLATLSGIVEGAHTLLPGRGCALITLGQRGTVLEAAAGTVPDDLSHVHEAAEALLRRTAPAEIALAAEDVLMVPLRTGAGTPLGVLLVFLGAERTLEAQELRLAEVFASFGGIAIANLDRFDLEQEMVEKLQDLVETRRQLTTGMSHELRTPLTCIKGFAATLRDHGETLSPELRKESLDAVLAHTDDLMQLVEQLLEVAEAEEGRTTVQVVPTDLRTVVESTLGMLGPLLAEREIVRDLAERWVRADPVLLRRVLANLLTNAVKYSPAEAAIGVRIAADGSGWAAVEVIDAGPGLDAHERVRVFEPFWRTAGPLRDQVRGAGVGLALVREYVAVMGGQVEVRSQVGEGSTFSVRLRAAERPG